MSGTTVDRTERVAFRVDEDELGRYLPYITKGEIEREFEAEDMPRVLDYDRAAEAPNDGRLMFCVEAGAEETTFYTFHFCLRGGFLFFFELEDVDEESGPYVTYHNGPRGVVPLENIVVDYPQGGRRLFREHLDAAGKGYEVVLRHEPEDDTEPRAPSFIVADKLSRRDEWAEAIRSRVELYQPTCLRAGYSSSTARKASPGVAPTTDVLGVNAQQHAKSSGRTEKGADILDPLKASVRKGAAGKSKAMQQQVLDVSDDADLAAAVVEFGIAQFEEKDWITHFFQMHNDVDAAAKCQLMEKWQMEMKRDLKGAVLEQYEYFVQASGEMTTMGHEVTSLKSQIEKQVQVIREMKGVDFTGAAKNDGRDELMGREDDDDDASTIDVDAFGRRGVDEKSFFSDLSSLDEGLSNGHRRNRNDDEDADRDDAPPIDVPEWLDDCNEEIESFIRECRYHDAIDLYLKSKAEVAELMDKHERPTAYRLTLKQRDSLRHLKRQLETLCDRISERLGDSLRRKNEALRQASKRDRGDMAALLAPSMSPCAVNDDSLYLQLLVKLGKNKEAADAFIARRSLLLLETLNERPISGAGTVDLVIYAAQLSQSFFSSLASSVEGFLDLFLSPTPQSILGGDTSEEVSVDASSLHSLSSKNLPAGATASVVLWCDAELTKFANAFGGTRVLSNLALSPPPRDSPKKPRVVGGGPIDDGMKERKNALEAAAQCIDQAFSYASRNLDGVGLPLTPRLAECIRVRLKGCEAEVSLLLDDKWDHLTKTWRISGDDMNGNGPIGL